MKTLRVDIWSDIACPWCYVGKRRLEAALRQFPHASQVQWVWRAFELDPSAPRERLPRMPYAQRLAEKYECSEAEGQSMVDRMTAVAREDGIDFHFEKIRPGNTFDAHRVLHLALERGVQDALKERLLRAYLTDGQPIGDPEVIAREAVAAGLNPGEVREVLASDRFAREVRADEHEARRLGISGVPFFVLDGRYGVSGAQPAEVLLSALTQAWNELPDTDAPGQTAAAEVCGPDGCVIPATR